MLLQASVLTQAEAAIRDHLPSQVLQIQARLQRHEESLDSIHGQFSQLTRRVVQLSTAMGITLVQDRTPSHQEISHERNTDATVFHTPSNKSLNSTTAPLLRSTTTASSTSSLFSSAPSMLSAAPAYVGPQVFGEMPAQNSWHGTQGTTPNYYPGHEKPIQNSGVQSVSTSSGWQNLDGMPQSYGLHNLNRQSIFLADETEHSYFTLPAEYPLEQSTPPMPPSATANVPTNVQDVSNVSEKMPVYDVYEADVTACRSCINPTVDTIEAVTEQVEVKADSGKPILSPERPIDGVYSFTNEKKSENELHAVCFNNTSDNAFSEEATYFTSPHGPVINAERFVKLTNKKSTQAVSILCVQEATMHYDDERFEININKHDISYPCDLSTDKEVPFLLQYQLTVSSLPRIWDPGIELLLYKKLHIFTWIQRSAQLILDNQIQRKNISSQSELSIAKGEHMQWKLGTVLSSFIILELISQYADHLFHYVILDNTCLVYIIQFDTCDRWRSLVLLFVINMKNRTCTSSLWSSCFDKSTNQPWDRGKDTKKFNDLIPEICSSRFNSMHYCQIFQKCNAMSSEHCSQQNMNFCGIALWLINFQPP